MKDKIFICALLLLAFCSEAVAGPSYTLDAKFSTLERVDGYPSCGSQRLLRDSFRLHDFLGHSVLVNYTRWELYTELDDAGYTWYTVSYKADRNAYTYLQMFLVANDRVIGGMLELHGRLPDRTPCADKVALLGYRL